VVERRFDTDALLEQVLEGNSDAFRSFYERYRGRVYRFIVRLCGNGGEGQAAYLSVWARFADSRRKCKDPKALKLAFFKSLESPLLQSQMPGCEAAPLSYLPKGLEEEGGWPVVLVQLVKKLPGDQRKRFLFRHELGLSINAISQIFGEGISVTRKFINDAEELLRQGLADAGCTRRVTLESLYRETRFLQPPGSWDVNILEGYQQWIEKRVPRALLQDPVVKKQSKWSLAVAMDKAMGRLKATSLSKNPQHSLGSAG
jgi:DNA-directed RNA polymerase specialized sigma24 family protein